MILLAVIANVAVGVVAPAGSDASAAAAPAAPVWRVSTSGTTEDLTAVSSPDRRHGWAVGAAGTILATTDAGALWQPQVACAVEPPCSTSERVRAGLTGVSFPDATHGWAVGDGGVILVTGDGGRSWTEEGCADGMTSQAQAECMGPRAPATDLSGVSFPDAFHGWAVGRAGTILATDDGGTTWRRQNACPIRWRCAFDPSADLTAVSFVDSTHGWVTGREGTILTTDDGGRTWDGIGPVAGRPSPYPDLLGVTLTIAAARGRASTAHVVGRRGTVVAQGLKGSSWYTYDSPSDFHQQLSGTATDLDGVAFADHAHGVAVGDTGTLLTTSDEGRTWVAAPPRTPHRLSAVALPDANDGYAVGDGGTVVAMHNVLSTLSVRSVAPDGGPTEGQTSVVIRGTGLASVTDVNFGLSWALSFVVRSDTEIVAVAPAHTGGSVDVTVTDASGVSSIAPTDRYSYLRAAGGEWTTTGSCPNTCSGPAVLLHDGRVLVEGTGSLDRADPTTDAELFDATTGEWSVTGALHTERSYHTATMLRDGRVLVAGGKDGDGSALDSVEIYDPGTGMWSLAAPMHHARFGHTASLLADGRVLVAGGSTDSPGGAPEVFDPSTGRWSATGRMHEERLGADALLLPSGSVLVIGGNVDTVSGPAGATDTAEFYNPRTGRWTVTGATGLAQVDASATLLRNGEVLLAGGYQPGDVGEPDVTLPYAELFDPAKGVWRPTGPLAEPRAGPAAVLLADGRVLVAGGGSVGARYCPCDPAPDAELYDVRSSRWTLLSSMQAARYYATATLLADGSVLVAGGQPAPGEPPLASAERFALASPGSVGSAAGIAVGVGAVVGGSVLTGVAIAASMVIRRRRRSAGLWPRSSG